MNILITGHTSGLGLAIAEYYLDNNATVFGLSRSFSESKHPRLSERKVDLSSLIGEVPALDSLGLERQNLNLAILNAAELGEIKPLSETKLHSLQKTLDLNVWSNKFILDWLIGKNKHPEQIIMISSGAALNAHFGWSAYSISKACLNTIAKLYAYEFPNSHISAVAPGLIDTRMQQVLRLEDSMRFPSLRRLHEAYETDALPSPFETAKNLVQHLPQIKTFPSGDYIDLRDLKK